MSFQGRVEAKCPSCSETTEVQVWTFVRAEKDGRLRDALVAGDLNLVSCPDCQALFYPESTVVYWDKDAELMAFIFPLSYSAEEARWRAKMKEDHDTMKKAVAGQSDPMAAEPVLCFGLEAFREMLQADDDLEDEVQVAVFLCKDLGLELAAVDRVFARREGLPRLLPVGKPGAKPTKATASAALAALVKANDRLTGFQRWQAWVGEHGLPALKP